MNFESRKINIINWVSSLQDEDILLKIEEMQKAKTDWWLTLSNEDKKAIQDGLAQLDNDEFLTHSEVRMKITEKFKF